MNIKVTGEGRDRFREDVGASLTLRALQSSGASPETIERIFPASSIPKVVSKWGGGSIYDIARECLINDGHDVLGLTRQDIAIAALGWPHKTALRSSAAHHVTGSFPSLTLDAVNKTMQAGAAEFRSTWRGPMRQGESARDFRKIHRVTLSSVPNLPIWPDNSEPAKTSIADGKETYAVEAYSTEISFSWRLLIGDNMGALSRIPFMLGNAAARTVNAHAWAQITSNPNMRDNVALFSAASGSRKRSNLTTGATDPTTDEIATMSNKMRQMRGENTSEDNESDDILELWGGRRAAE